MDINTKILDTLEKSMDKNVTDKKPGKFMRECCDHLWSRKFDYERHLKSKKHAQMRKIIGQMRNSVGLLPENAQNTDSESQKSYVVNTVTPKEECVKHKNIETRYICECCQFSTTNKKESNKHRKTKQHIRNENNIEDFIEIDIQYVCLSCDKMYKKYKSCWEHIKRCGGKSSNNEGQVSDAAEDKMENIVLEIVDQPPPEMKTPHGDDKMISKELFKEVCEILVDKLLENNQNTMIKIVEAMSQSQNQQAVIQANNTNNNIHISNSNINSNNNNHCTINMFLNEKCKDAVNITDWVHHLRVDYDHLYYTGENGFQKGLTNILVENLNLCDIYNRPIHFTDVKRDRMYIRDADAWTKHENNDKLIEVLELSARQACIRLTEWMNEHEDVPDYHNLDSELGKQYMALMVNVIRPEAVRLKAYPKVMKELAKTAQLRKEDQV